jgi:hypothetical protein
MWLWRCGQIDVQPLYHTDNFGNKSAGYEGRLFSYQLYVTDRRIELSRVMVWIDTAPRTADDRRPFQLDKHPWDGRHYGSFTYRQMVCLQIGDPFDAITTQAPGWQAVDAVIRPWLGDSICDSLISR